jgi:hypothetical protein
MLQDRKGFLAIFGTNSYVPGMAYSGSAGVSLGPSRHTLGTPATAGTIATLISGQGALGPISYLSSPLRLDSTYGRTISLIASAAPTGTALTVDVVGYDYLGQPMVERINIGVGVATAVLGLKAWGWIAGTRLNSAAGNAVTFSVSAGVSLGLPWKGTIVAAKEGTTNMTYAQINTASVAPVLTDPQTAVTGDPRGLYTPVTPPNGVLAYEVAMIGDTSVNAAGNGGLLGIRQLAF